MDWIISWSKDNKYLILTNPNSGHSKQYKTDSVAYEILLVFYDSTSHFKKGNSFTIITPEVGQFIFDNCKDDEWYPHSAP